MMSGLMRTLLPFLAVAAVATPLVVLTPARAAEAQSTTRCTQTKNVVSCDLRYVWDITSGYQVVPVIVVQYMASDGSWTDIGTDQSAPPWASDVRLDSFYRSSIGATRLYDRYIHLTVTGLGSNTTYTLRGSYSGRKSNNAAFTAYSDSITIRTLTNLADAPEQLSVTRNDAGDEATVTWAAPNDAVTSYLIQRAELQRSSGVAVWGDETYFTTADASSTTHTDTGLDPDKTYQYQVAGVNASGTGFYSVTVRTIGAAGEVAVTVDDRTFDAIPTPDHGQLPTGYDTSTGDAEMVAAVDSSITQILSPTGLTWDAAKMRHFLVVFGAGGLAGLGLIGNNRLGGKLSGQSVLLAFLLFNLGLWLGVRWLGFPWYWAMLPTLLTVGWGLMTFGRKVTA